MRRTAALVVVMLALLAAGTAVGAPKPAGVTWGSVQFTDPGKLSSWLSSRGVRYTDWRRLHPAAQYLLTHPAPSRQAVTASPATRSDRLGAVFATFLVVAILLVLVSAAGDVLVRLARFQVEPGRVAAARLGVAGGGLAVAIGTALAWWL
jgi:hypothetical protein